MGAITWLTPCRAHNLDRGLGVFFFTSCVSSSFVSCARVYMAVVRVRCVACLRTACALLAHCWSTFTTRACVCMCLCVRMCASVPLCVCACACRLQCRCGSVRRRVMGCLPRTARTSLQSAMRKPWPATASLRRCKPHSHTATATQPHSHTPPCSPCLSLRWPGSLGKRRC